MTAAEARSSERLELTLKMAAPYFAMIVFWLVFHDAWLAVLSYHAQILLWSRGRLPALAKARWTPLSLVIVPSALLGPLLYVAIPYLARVDFRAWLVTYHLTGPGFVAMIFYYALVNPVLEESHWAPLRERTPLSHLAFAGYHLLILWSLLDVPALAVTFVVLATVSWLWQRLRQRSGSLLPAIASHAVADLGIIVVAWLLR